MTEDELYKKIQIVESDDEKMELIEKLKTPYLKETAINFLSEDVNKLKMADTLKLEMQKARIYIQVVKNKELEDVVIGKVEEIKNKRTASEVVKNVRNFKKRINSFVRLLYKGNCDEVSREIITEMILKDIMLKQLYEKDLSIEELINILDCDKSKAVAINTFVKDENKAKEAIEKIVGSELKEQMKLQYKSRDELEKKFGTIKNELKIPKDMTIGVELEAEGENAAIFYGRMLLDKWKAVSDNSLQNGVEIVSPILKNNRKDMEDLYFITKIMKSMRLRCK